MMLLGWCRVCHRIRQVSVTVPMPGSVQVGVCRDCEAR